MIMKKIILIAAILTVNTTTYAQPFGDAAPAYKIIELQYENSSGEKGTTRFKYDNQNKLCKAVWSLDDKSRHSTNYYEHDLNGNLISTFRDFSDGLTSFESFRYDAAGNKISECFYRSDSISGSASYRYNGDQLIQADFANHKGWLSGKLEFKYNNKNKKEQGILRNGNKVVCEIFYDYDSIGNLMKEFWDFGKWSQTFNYIYERKKQNRQFYSNPYISGESEYRISKENYTFNDKVGGPSLYYYDEHGLLAKKVFIRNDSLTTNTFYDYDREGKLLSSKRVYSDSSIALFSYEYDKINNLIRRNFFKADTLYGFESYLYNSDGELLKAYLKNFDGWLSGTINFKSNELGEITTGEFIGEDGFNASVVFNYNRASMISQIIWKFSFGKFQQYDFEYERINSP